MPTMKNLHIPLPIQWYEKLKEFSNVSEISATEIVRNAVIDFLKAQEKNLLIMLFFNLPLNMEEVSLI